LTHYDTVKDELTRGIIISKDDDPKERNRKLNEIKLLRFYDKTLEKFYSENKFEEFKMTQPFSWKKE